MASRFWKWAGASLAPLLGLGLSCCGAPAEKRAVFPAQAVEPAPHGKVLFVASAEDTQTLADGSQRKTGTFLGELYEPRLALERAGYQITMATVAGAAVAIDPESLKEKYWASAGELAAARRYAATAAELRSPLTLEQAHSSADDFQGLVIPGGQGVMEDLLDNREAHALVAHFAQHHRPIGLVCHAPALLTRMAKPASLAGRNVTSVSGFEEWFIETFVMGERARFRGIGERLQALGFGHSAAFPGSSRAVRDCNLVTSQNPFSNRDFSQLYLRALDDFRRGGRCEP